MKPLILAALLSLLSLNSPGDILFSHPPTGTGGLILSSWLDPDGSDADMYGYDDFTLATTSTITDIQWRGGYYYGAPYGHVTNFRVTFYDSIAGGSQPSCGNPQLPETYLANYNIGGIAGETSVGTFGGVAMYDYSYTLSSPFPANAGHKYWVRIEAVQVGYPDWGVATGTGGDNQHFAFSTGSAHFSFGAGDAAFTLIGPAVPTYPITTSVSPLGSGVTSGDGSYPSGALAALSATANPGFGFLSWTVGGTTVSTSANYSFTVSTTRTLVANFVTAYTITTASYPSYGGTTTGAGTYNEGTPVTAIATPRPGYFFVNWTDYGNPVSSSATYNFTPSADMTLVANFALDSMSATFDFDTGYPSLVPTMGMPATQLAGNGTSITAYFSAPAGAFSIQADSTTFFSLSQFSANYLYPNTSGCILQIQFDHNLNAITLNFCTADFHQVEIPTSIKLSAYKDNLTNAVGNTTAHGTYASDTMPMGFLSYNSGGPPFNLVKVEIPGGQPSPAAEFLVDNITVVSTALPVGLSAFSIE